MERSEPSFIPEWLRNNGGGTGAGNAGHHLDGPLLASPKSRNANSFGNSHGSHLSSVERGSCNYSWKPSVSNGYIKQDKNSYGRSYSGSTRNHWYRDRGRMGIDDNCDSEYSDSLCNIISARIRNDTPRRSQSMISRRPSDLPTSNNINNGENGSVAISTGSTGIQKVSFGRNFPVLVSDERPTARDISKVSSLRFGKGVQGLPTGNSSSMHQEGWTSTLVAPSGSGSGSISSPPALDPSPSVAAVAPPVAASVSSGGMSTGHKKSGLFALAPALPQNATQHSVQSQRFEELASIGTKRLIPMTSSVPKTLVLNPSDKLKPMTAMKTNEVSGPKNELQRISSLQLGSQPVNGGSVPSDGTKSCSTGKMHVLKLARENGHSASQIAADVPIVSGNGQSTCVASLASLPSKVSNMKLVEKKCSQSQLQSRSDFFNMVRKKSMSKTIVPSNSGDQNSNERKEIANDPPTPGEGCEVKICSNVESELVGRSSNNMVSNLCEHEIIHPNEEEEAFLRSLGWEDSAADEGGLTEEEINSFVQKLKIMTQADHIKRKPGSKLHHGLQSEVLTQSET